MIGDKIIQHRATKLFLSKQGSWMADPMQAKPFPTALTAFRFAVDSGFPDIEVLIRTPSAPKPIIRRESAMFCE